jgi:hypothetical protein
MNSWMTRGLQIAVLGGGMWALGAGIATADTPTGTTLSDATGGALSISVPVDVSGNALDLLGSAAPTPEVHRDLLDGAGGGGGTLSLTVPVTITGNAVGVVGDAAPPSTPAPAAPAPSTGGTASGPTASTTSLAYTGADVGGLLGLALALLTLGGGAVLLGRRRAR